MDRRHHNWATRLRVYGWAWLPIALAFFAWHTWRGTAGGDDLVTPGADFINFWSAARLGLQGHMADVYDLARFYHFDTATIGQPVVRHYYSYPPVTVLMTLPWGPLPYITGLVAWLAGGCIAFMLLVRAAWPGRRSLPDVALYSIAVPAVLMNLLAGPERHLDGCPAGRWPYGPGTAPSPRRHAARRPCREAADGTPGTIRTARGP